ncbi:Asp-tRNA(Asn)/Glu-tRNA(Gln) amidotransferase subunit GatC [bacterium]|jgi:aspartyl-tRNA(Asn)/glutamyl-tRNA(Gln) amidotransferase subunit C|nr:Asp-tRNA(Asn)/Glu-tRNA(Gln) amidotransferase subunit GatC [bacterium]
MGPVTPDLIRKIADLSRLELKPDEMEGYVRSIGDILAHVEQLRELNTEGVEPMVYGIDDSLRLRPDEVVDFGLDSSGKPKILTHAPEVVDDGFKVPRIIG